ncbi:HD domain-containing protein [Longispora albida]|uniref:HD domain-containing protein n=1 Tax=Longispora albida TaxID=203523 RepID=UPI00037F82CA|nr:HD domain-containing protein [Longispora albida]
MHRVFDTLEAVDAIATTLHRRQVDKSGQPYIQHCRAVAVITAELGGSLTQQLAALLHDSVEDVDVTLDELVMIGIPAEVVTLVDALTKRSGAETHEQYLDRLVAVPGAALVKRADVMHNSSPERLAQLGPATQERLRVKYASALARLDEFAAGEQPR